MSLCDPVEIEPTSVPVSYSDTDDDSDGGLQSVEPIDDKSEFRNTELEELVLKEGECYALLWGIMHFRQYLHRNHFVLRTNHKPLEWLATVSDAHGRRGRWIGMLHDFSFKILHRPGMKHTNVDALSRNPMGEAADDEDFNEEIQDIGTNQGDSIKTT
jgi:hypothetical protein